MAPASDAAKDGEGAAVVVSGGSLPPQGKMLGKLDQKDFRQVISKGMKTYGMFRESSKKGQVEKLSRFVLQHIEKINSTTWKYWQIALIEMVTQWDSKVITTIL